MNGDEPTNAKTTLRAAAIAVFCVAAIAIAQNVAIGPYLSAQPRVTTDFSPALLDAKLRALASQPPQIVFLGDSAIWGYTLPADRTAIQLLRDRGIPAVNFGFKAGSAANDYVLAKLFEAYGVRPKLVVIEVNQRSFNPADQSYKSLHPAIAALGATALTPEDRSVLDVKPGLSGTPALLDRLASYWSVYGMRADLRALLVGDVDALSKQKPSEEQFLGTYDLTPLDEKNVSVHYLEKAVDVFRSQGIPVVAYLTPTNHALLHDFIDDPGYAANGRYIVRALAKRGVRTIDLDRSFPTDEFIDNAHLTEAGQRHLADALASEVLPSNLP